MSIDFSDFAVNALSTYNLDGLNIDQDLALDFLAKEQAEEFAELNKESTKSARFDFFCLSHTNRDHFKEHLIEIDPKRKIICGIRHFNLGETSFVHLAPNFQSNKEELIAIYHKCLAQYFEPFQPKFIRFYTKSKIPAVEISGCDLVQHIRNIRLIQFPEERYIVLRNPKDDQYYSEYKQEYASFHQQYPDLAEKVPINSQSLTEKSRMEGLLREVYYKGERIGLIAGLEAKFLAYKSLYFIEILVKEEFRGKGLGKAIQRKYIAECGGDREFVWGIIDYSNKASLKTAQATMRQLVRYEVFAKL